MFYIPKAQITAVVVNWTVLLQSMSALNPLFEEIAIELGFKRVNLLNMYLESPPEKKSEIVQDYLHEKVRKLLKFKSSHQIEPFRNFRKLGMDTSRMTKLKNHIQFDLEQALTLPFNFVEEHPDIEKLTKALCNAIEEAIKSRPKSKLEKPIAVVGLQEGKIALELIDDATVQVSMEDLTEKTVKKLNDKVKGKAKSAIVIVDKK